MKLPSIQHLTSSIWNTLMRFPFAVAVTVIGMLAALSLIQPHLNESLFKSELLRTLFTCSLGLPLAIGIEIFIHRNKLSLMWQVVLRSLTAFFLIAYFTYFAIDIDRSPPIFLIIQFFVLNVAFHLFVSFAPFLNINDWKSGTFSFWDYNKTLFIRILTAFLYSGVLFAGLSIALLAINVLLNIDINERVYARLFVVIATLFNTLFFLSGIPHTYTTTREESPYPIGLKMFTQYVLIPLVTIYVAILYAYMAKIITLATLPKGWVSYLIISFSIVGMLSFLLVHPIRKMIGNSWIKLFSKAFYILLIPLITLLFIAILHRVKEYGITELRYIILALAVWLAFICLYFNLSKIKNIRIIPISLCITALVVSISAFKVSEKSQLHRLKTMLIQNNAIDEQGHFTVFKDSIPYNHFQEIQSILNYFESTHQVTDLQPLFKQSLPAFFTQKAKENDETGTISAYRQKEYLTQLLNMNKVKTSTTDGNNLMPMPIESPVYSFQANELNGNRQRIVYNITGYQYAMPFKIYDYTTDSTEIVLENGQKASFGLTPKHKIRINIYDPNKTKTIEIPTDSLAAVWIKKYMLNNDNYIQTNANNLYYEKKINDKISIKVYFQYLTFNKEENGVLSAEGILFLKQ